MSFNCYYIRTADLPSAGGGGQEVITRDNYEAYFVMYVDDELNATERKAVEQFIQQNPDLEEELVMLQQSVLRPDEAIVFEQKESLFKHTGHLPINDQNCEEFFVLYGDDELTNEEKDLVEQFVYKHPQYQADFELIQQVKLVPDNGLRFPDKTYLYRTEEDDAKVIIFPWWRFSAAAIALLTIGSLAWYIATHTGTTEVARTEEKTKPALKTQQPQPAAIKERENKAAIASKNDEDYYAYQVDPNKAIDVDLSKLPAKNNNRKKNISNNSNIQQPSYVKHIEQQPEQAPAGDNENSLSARSVNVAVNNSYERPSVKSTVIKNTIAEPIAVNTTVKQPDEEPDQQAQLAVLTQPVNKTPLRGFFRKVSRVVDKVTSPDDNGKGGIRIANLAFALK
jgi:hypothetical protein